MKRYIRSNNWSSNVAPYGEEIHFDTSRLKDFYGLRGIKVIDVDAKHGPYIMYKKKIVDYHDVEDALWAIYVDECEENGAFQDETFFEAMFVPKHRADAVEYIEALPAVAEITDDLSDWYTASIINASCSDKKSVKSTTNVCRSKKITANSDNQLKLYWYKTNAYNGVLITDGIEAFDLDLPLDITFNDAKLEDYSNLLGCSDLADAEHSIGVSIEKFKFNPDEFEDIKVLPITVSAATNTCNISANPSTNIEASDDEIDYNSLYDNIVSYMNDEIREDVHSDIAPCTNQEFIDEYIKRDPSFVNLIKSIFDVDLRKDKVFASKNPIKASDDEEYEPYDEGFGMDSNGEYIDESTVEELCRIANEIVQDSDLSKVYSYPEVDPETFKDNYYMTGTYSGAYLDYVIYAKSDSDKLDISDCMQPDWDGTFPDLQRQVTDRYDCIMDFTIHVKNDEIVEVLMDADIREDGRYDEYDTKKFPKVYDIEKICNKVADDFEPAVREIHTTVSNI